VAPRRQGAVGGAQVAHDARRRAPARRCAGWTRTDPLEHDIVLGRAAEGDVRIEAHERARRVDRAREHDEARAERHLADAAAERRDLGRRAGFGHRSQIARLDAQHPPHEQEEQHDEPHLECEQELVAHAALL
jgi:hypothetical protein